MTQRVIRLVSKKNESSFTIEALSGEKKVSEYRFKCGKSFNQIGSELILATLTSWATIDLCFAAELLVSFPVKENVKQYIQSHFYLVTATYAHIYEKPIASLSFIGVEPLLKIEPLYLRDDAYFLGNTGGRDSTLCKHILESVNKEIHYYTVSYDEAADLPDGHIDMQIHDAEIYRTISISGIKRASNIISTHQADDIHVTFAAPYISLGEETPANLAVGLPWESIHLLKNGCPDLVPTESYASIHLLIDLFKSFGIANFEIVSPIATLHSLGVYTLLSRIIGEEKVQELDSCWYSHLFGGDPCEACPKCQRLKSLFQYMGYENYLNTSFVLNIKSADFLFGSLFGYEVFIKQSEIKWQNFSILDKTSLGFSQGFDRVLKERYQVPSIDMEGFSVDYQRDQQTWAELLEQIAQQIGLSFDELPDMVVHQERLPFLPYEKDYKWKRKHQILNCYASFEVYDPADSEWITLKISSEGPHFKTPHLPIFKKWLSLDFLSRQYAHLFERGASTLLLKRRTGAEQSG